MKESRRDGLNEMSSWRCSLSDEKSGVQWNENLKNDNDTRRLSLFGSDQCCVVRARHKAGNRSQKRFHFMNDSPSDGIGNHSAPALLRM